MDWDWGSNNPFTLARLLIVISLIIFGPAVVVIITTLVAALVMLVRGRASTMVQLGVLAILLMYVVAILALIIGPIFFPKFNAYVALHFGCVGVGMLTIALSAAWCWTHPVRPDRPTTD